MNLVDISIRRPVTVMMFTIAFLLFGSVLFNRMGVNLLPELSYPTLTVRTEYEGAAPAEVENLVSKPIEEVLGTVKNVRQIHSISRAGQSDVMLEFHWGTDMSIAGLDVREKLDRLMLPLDVQSPALLRFNPSLAPIVRLGLIRTDVTDRFSNEQLIELRRFAEDELKKDLESVAGIAAVKISGGLEDQIQVLLNQSKLDQLNLTIDQVSQKLQTENVNLSGGRLEDGQQQLLIRTINQFASIEEMADTIVSARNGKLIYLRDIAEVRQGYKEREAISRVNGKESVEIAIYKEGDANTVKVAERLQARLKQVEKNLPENLTLEPLYDQSQFISQAINEVISAGIIGGILAMIVLYSFLRHFWSTVIISISIPVSVITSFNFMYASDISLNIMSLGGIALAIGLLVDNAIVVLENIASKKQQNMANADAAASGTKEVVGAITASTLTTIAVFLPLAFVEGIAGQLFNDQALTVTFALLVSLAVAITLIPMLSSRESKELEPIAEQNQSTPTQSKWRYLKMPFVFMFLTFPGWIITLLMIAKNAVAWLLKKLFTPLAAAVEITFGRLQAIYQRSIHHALKMPFLVLITGVGIFAATLALVPKLGMELIPQLSQGEFNIELKASPGTPIEKTDQLVQQARDIIAQEPLVIRSYSISGTGNRLDASPEKGGENAGEINVVLKPGITKEKEEQLIKAFRDQLSQLPGLEVKISRPTLFSFDTPLEIEIRGYDLDKLKQTSLTVSQLLQESERFSDVKSTIEAGYPEIRIEFDHQKIAALGLDVPQIAQRVVKQIKGDVATKYSFRDRKIDVLVRSQENQRNSVASISQLLINTESDKAITLASIATINQDTAPSEIHRLDQERVAIVSANLRFGDLAQAAAEAQEILNQVPQAFNIFAEVTGQSEEMKASFDSLKFALALAIFLVYLVMASQFESLLHPFVILFSVPLALIGAVWALYLTGSNISVVVFIGLILLAGIVVNNAIVLIDKVNQLRMQGIEKLEAIKQAGNARLRPILITTMTTVLGMLPLALGIGEGGELRAPMAITVIGGLLISTFLTLLFIPVLYSVMDRSVDVKVSA